MVVSQALRVLVKAEQALAFALSSKMDSSACAEEGYSLATQLGLSPYATGIYTQPPLFLVAREFLPLSLFVRSVLVAILLQHAFEASGSKSRLAYLLGVCLAFLEGHRLDAEEFSLLVAALGATKGQVLPVLLGTSFALYDSPANTYLLILPLFKLWRDRSRHLSKPTFSLPRYLLLVSGAWAALVLASSYFLKFRLEVKEFQDMDLADVTLHWMRRSYFSQFQNKGPHENEAADVFAPNASLVWYFDVQMFPEMKRMFLILTLLQPLLLAIPLTQELVAFETGEGDRLDMHLLVSQLLVCNMFRKSYDLGHLLLEFAVFSLFCGSRFNVSKPRVPKRLLFLLALTLSAILALLCSMRNLWLYYGVANSNHYWAMVLCLVAFRFGVVLLTIKDYKTLKSSSAKAV